MGEQRGFGEKHQIMQADDDRYDEKRHFGEVEVICGGDLELL